MYTLLPLWKEKTFPTVKASPDGIESTIFTCDFDDSIQAEKVEGRSACFEDQEVGSYK
jgi:hypothetical protein